MFMEGVKISQPFSAAHFPCFYIKNNICIDYFSTAAVDTTKSSNTLHRFYRNQYSQVGIILVEGSQSRIIIIITMAQYDKTQLLLHFHQRERGVGDNGSPDSQWTRARVHKMSFKGAYGD